MFNLVLDFKIWSLIRILILNPFKTIVIHILVVFKLVLDFKSWSVIPIWILNPLRQSLFIFLYIKVSVLQMRRVEDERGDTPDTTS